MGQTKPQKNIVEITSSNAKDVGSYSALHEVSPAQAYAPNHSMLLPLLRKQKLNWFAFVHELKTFVKGNEDEVVNEVSALFAQRLSGIDLDG